MKISNIVFKKLNTDGKQKALVSVIIDDCFAIHEIKIIQTNEKSFIAMPSSVNEDGVHKDIVHPINKEARKALEYAILTAYHSCHYTNDLDF